VQLEIAVPSLAPFPYDGWESVFAHEAFHCYQLKHKMWRRWFRKARAGSQALKKLASLYQHGGWLRADVEDQLQVVQRVLENCQLSPVALRQIQKSRSQHRTRLYRLSRRLGKTEKAAEIIEGAARFVELGLERRSAEHEGRPTVDAPDRGLSVADGQYYYATGYGLMRLLDISGQPWRETVLKNGIDLALDNLVASRTKP
jgi:hypothetical protein